MQSLSDVSLFHATIRMEFQDDELKGKFIIDEVQSKKVFNTFIGIFIFTIIFGVLLLIFLKRLKKLTHGAEDIKEV